MKKFSTFIIFVIIIVFAIGYVSNLRKQSAGYIPIGVLAPMTGPLSSINDLARKGLDLALEEINQEENGPKIQLLYEDIETCFPKNSVDATKKFIHIDKTPFIFSTICGGNQVVATSDITEENKVIQFSSSAVIGKISQMGDYIFRNIASNVDEMNYLTDFAKNTLRKKKAYIIHNNTEWGHSYKDAFKNGFQALGGEITGESAPEILEKDFRTYLVLAKNSGADVIYINVVNGSPIGLLLKQAAELNITQQFITSYNTIQPDTIEFSSGAAEGIYYPYPKIPDTEETRAFQKKYQEKFGITPEIHAANSYDLLKISAGAIKGCGRDTDCLKDFLYNLKDYPGMGGMTSFDQNGDVKKEFEIWTVQDGVRQPLNP